MSTFIKSTGFCILLAILLTSCELKVVEFNDSTRSAESLQRAQQEYLGAKATIEFIGENAKCTIYSNKDNKSETFILTKISNNSDDYKDIYQYESNKEKLTLRISKIAFFVYSAELELRRKEKSQYPGMSESFEYYPSATITIERSF